MIVTLSVPSAVHGCTVTCCCTQNSSSLAWSYAECILSDVLVAMVSGWSNHFFFFLVTRFIGGSRRGGVPKVPEHALRVKK